MSENRKAIIYCRVSHTKQRIVGTGLASQEHRCRAYASMHGYEVETVFTDDVSGMGDFMQHPGMTALLEYLEDHPLEQYVVIFDDLKRFSRDPMFHWQLKEKLAAYGASIECLNFKFEDTPEGEFIELVVSGQAKLESQQNRRQTLQKMRAKLERGYWVFSRPVGYRSEMVKGFGNIVVPDEPLASIVRDGLEGFASGRYQTQSEVMRFWQSCPEFPKDSQGIVRAQRVKELLTRVFYAGYIEHEGWGIARFKGQHEPLIDYATFLKIQERLKSGAYAPARKNIAEDFPLRGFVACGECNNPLTACWSSGSHKKYPYYYCVTKGCSLRSKMIRLDQLEGDFEELLGNLVTAPDKVNVAASMLREWWDALAETRGSIIRRIDRAISGVEKDIEKVVDRLVSSSSETAVLAYERRIETLERSKLELQEKRRGMDKPVRPYEKALRTAVEFLKNPLKIWQLSEFEHKHAVLRLAFSGRPSYVREKGFSNDEIALPFKWLGGVDDPKSKMARPVRLARAILALGLRFAPAEAYGFTSKRQSCRFVEHRVRIDKG